MGSTNIEYVSLGNGFAAEIRTYNILRESVWLVWSKGGKFGTEDWDGVLIEFNSNAGHDHENVVDAIEEMRRLIEGVPDDFDAVIMWGRLNGYFP